MGHISVVTTAESCYSVKIGAPRPQQMVSAITSAARTGAKFYYQSGPGLVQSGPMAAMLGGVDIGSPSAPTRTTEP